MTNNKNIEVRIYRFEFRMLNSEVEDSSEPASAIVIPAKAGPLEATPSPTTHN